MTRNQINAELNNLYADRVMLDVMSEEQACKHFNVDCKREAEEAIENDIAYYECELSKLSEEDNDEYWSNNGFASEADYNRYRYGLW